MNFFLIRLDDACPTMCRAKWNKMEHVLDKYGVKPMVGIIPHNQDPKQMIDAFDDNFWDNVRRWDQKGWTIALHGYNHVYSTNEGGINPLWNKSEFAGHPLEFQKEKIRMGVAILRDHGINPRYFFAPSHTFDENTLSALREESDIRVISDTIAIKPYKYNDFIFVPQQSGHPIRLPFGGLVTICYHPNTMLEESFKNLENFLSSHKGQLISFDSIDTTKVKDKTIVDSMLSCMYFLRRKLR